MTQRSRIHLSCLPMADIDENAAIVNALQRHSTVVVQKSIQEGFGLTVAEAMWKSRPVVASAVGGIKDQIVDGETGVLLDDPLDLRAFGEVVRAAAGQIPIRAKRIGRNAREQVRRHFLVNRHARQYIELLGAVIGESANSSAAHRRGPPRPPPRREAPVPAGAGRPPRRAPWRRPRARPRATR